MSEKQRAVIAKTHQVYGKCLTDKELKDDFIRLGIRSGMNLLVHCSLSRIGWICGGPVTLINVLLDLLGSDGTLIMPSHTADNSEPKYWQNPPVPEPWFQIIRESMPAYQPEITPTYQMGIVAETFRHWPQVQRSQHPLFSMIARGKNAQLILNEHNDCCGEQSPLARLYDLQDNAFVLLLGVQHQNNTSIHLAEYRYQINRQIQPKFTIGTAIQHPLTKTRQWHEWIDYDYTADDFNQIGNEFEQIQGNVFIGNIGLAQSRLMKQYVLVDFATQWMDKHRTNQFH